MQQKTPGRRGKITRLEWLLCPPGQRFVHLSIHRANRVPPTPPPARNRCGYEKGVTTSPPQLPKFSRNNSAEYQRQRREVSQREIERQRQRQRQSEPLRSDDFTPTKKGLPDHNSKIPKCYNKEKV